MLQNPNFLDGSKLKVLHSFNILALALSSDSEFHLSPVLLLNVFYNISLLFLNSFAECPLLPSSSNLYCFRLI